MSAPDINQHKENFNKDPRDPSIPFNQMDDNRIVPQSKLLLSSVDEFTNDKTDHLVKMFHSSIKAQLHDPDKRFILLVNENVNENEFKVIWANNPQYENTLFIKQPEDERKLLSQSIGKTKISDTPFIVPLKDAMSNSYVTTDQGQHFPTEILKYSDNSFWYSDIKEDKLLTVQFLKLSRVKYIGINFYDPARIQMVFDVMYKTDKRDENGEFIIKKIASDLENKPEDGIQIIEFKEPILTEEIYLFFKITKSNEAGVNYVIVVSNELTQNGLQMFTNISKQ